MTRRGNAPVLLWVVLGLVLLSFGLLVAALVTSRTGWAWGSVGASGVAAGLLVADWMGRRRVEPDASEPSTPSEPTARPPRADEVSTAQWVDDPTEVYASRDRGPTGGDPSAAGVINDTPAPAASEASPTVELPAVPDTTEPPAASLPTQPSAASGVSGPPAVSGATDPTVVSGVSGPPAVSAETAGATGSQSGPASPAVAAAVGSPIVDGSPAVARSAEAGDPPAGDQPDGPGDVEAGPGDAADPGGPGDPSGTGAAGGENSAEKPSLARGLAAAGAVAAVLPRRSSLSRTSLRRPRGRGSSPETSSESASPEPDAGAASGEVAPAATPGSGERGHREQATDRTGGERPAASGADRHEVDPAMAALSSGVGEPGAVEVPDPAVEPREERADVADAMIVTELTDEVVVIDERPRYHLRGCPWVGARETLPLPLDEARELGFSPCAVCRPDSTLAARNRTTRN